MDDLNGKVAVVTGEAGGIGRGRGITGALLEEGARGVIADVEEPVLLTMAEEWAEAGQLPPAALSL